MKSIYYIVLEQIKQIKEIGNDGIRTRSDNEIVKFVHNFDNLIFENDEIDELSKIIKDEEASEAITNIISMSSKTDNYILGK